jgi:hypothetical protein
MEFTNKNYPKNGERIPLTKTATTSKGINSSFDYRNSVKAD